MSRHARCARSSALTRASLQRARSPIVGTSGPIDRTGPRNERVMRDAASQPSQVGSATRPNRICEAVASAPSVDATEPGRGCTLEVARAVKGGPPPPAESAVGALDGSEPGASTAEPIMGRGELVAGSPCSACLLVSVEREMCCHDAKRGTEMKRPLVRVTDHPPLRVKCWIASRPD